jgi:molecular chaperone HscB
MSFSPTADYFELFGLQPGFAVDLEQLALRFRELQRAAHPDRFANASSLDKRLSVQQAALINEAYQVLKTPLTRGRYLLEQCGASLDDSDTSMDPAFLMEQMALREAIGAVAGAEDPFASLDTLRQRIEGMEREMVAQLQQLIDEALASRDPQTLQAGVQLVRKMQFMQRLLDEVDSLEENLVHQG